MSDELIEIFVAEGRELLDQAMGALSELRGGASGADSLERLFRAFHTLKGSAALMGFKPMTDVFHVGEDRLSALRAGDERLDAALAEALIAILDQTETWFEATATTGAIPTDTGDVVGRLIQQLAGEASPSSPEARRDGGAQAANGPAAARTLRVEAARLDELVAAADELAVLKNRLAQLAAEAARSLEPRLARTLGRAQAELDRQVLRVHAAATRLRVTPLNPVFRRFPRLVRETAAGLGKEVELAIAGGDVEVDKTIVDTLFEPLLHLVRNAIDHGVEAPEARRAAGKRLPARLSLTASAQGDEVVIEISDDGRGVDPAGVRAAAAVRGVADAATLAAMTDEAVIDLIFAPGFSTARKVGDISGRGVGLDAVRASVTALGGRVALRSEPGRGARFLIVLPTSVRLARIMTVRAGAETFGLPLESVVETARVAAGHVTPVRSGRAFVWRDQAAPLLELSDLLQLPPPTPRDEIKVVIVRAGDDVVGVAVDDFGERLESPLRPMTGLLAGAAGVVGATLMGDGRVLMVLDLQELIG